MKKHVSSSIAPGQTVVLLGMTDYDRQLLVFKDPVSFVEDIRSTEKSNTLSNEEFMRKVSETLKEVDYHVPYHSEDAFVKALVKAGICKPVILH